MANCADLLARIDALASVASDLLRDGLLTPQLGRVFDKSKAVLGDRIAAALHAADGDLDGRCQGVVSFGGKFYGYYRDRGFHLAEVRPVDAATVPVADEVEPAAEE